jgi:hypothetical protein
VGARLRLTLAALAVASLAVGGAACKSKHTESPPPAPSAKAPDHLAKGEIPESSVRAYTLPLPLHCQIRARFPKSVHVGSEYSLEELAGFTRARVKDGRTSAGATETRFDDVVVKTDPSRVLTIEIRTGAGYGPFRTQMVVTDVTPPPAPSGETDADRWKKAGMTPDGKLLNPLQMQ